jgi:hypothetical protein
MDMYCISRIRFYDEWSDKYEEDLVLVGNYSGHTKCVEAFLSLQLNRFVFKIEKQLNLNNFYNFLQFSII